MGKAHPAVGPEIGCGNTILGTLSCGFQPSVNSFHLQTLSLSLFMLILVT